MKIKNLLTFTALLFLLLFLEKTDCIAQPKTVKILKPVVVSKTEDILKQSQISYRAEGGFTAIRSYSVIISCVDGRISTLSTIDDPKYSSPLRHVGTLNKTDYLELWTKLQKMAIFDKKDAPSPRLETLDEFTVTFDASVGKRTNEFVVPGCSRPEASQYFAFRKLLDSAVGMETLWSFHQVQANAIRQRILGE